MTANHSIDPAQFLSERLEHAEPDLLRAMLKAFIDALMGAEADALCGAPYGAPMIGSTDGAHRMSPGLLIESPHPVTMSA